MSYITSYYNASQKYGIGYIDSVGSFGVIFNDQSCLFQSKEESIFYCHNQSDDFVVLMDSKIVTLEIYQKLRIFNSIKNKLKKEKNQFSFEVGETP